MRARKGTRGQFLNAGRGLYSEVSLSLSHVSLRCHSLYPSLSTSFFLSLPSCSRPTSLSCFNLLNSGIPIDLGQAVLPLLKALFCLSPLSVFGGWNPFVQKGGLCELG